MRWVTNKRQAEYMKGRTVQNISRSLCNEKENWAAARLEASGLRWKRQAQWGARIFDFWNHEKGVAVEIDGPEHDARYDKARDEYNSLRSGIIVLRVRNKNEEDMRRALADIAGAEAWAERRALLGLRASGKKARRKLLREAGRRPAHGNW